jgi:hypothetical protein
MTIDAVRVALDRSLGHLTVLGLFGRTAFGPPALSYDPALTPRIG